MYFKSRSTSNSSDGYRTNTNYHITVEQINNYCNVTSTDSTLGHVLATSLLRPKIKDAVKDVVGLVGRGRTEQWRGYTYRNVYSSATKSHRKLKLVTNNCDDNHKI